VKIVTKTPQAFVNSSPGNAMGEEIDLAHETLKSLPAKTQLAGQAARLMVERFANSYRVHKIKFRLSQGIALGWNLPTPSAF
jgi:hypothetical protein